MRVFQKFAAITLTVIAISTSLFSAALAAQVPGRGQDSFGARPAHVTEAEYWQLVQRSQDIVHGLKNRPDSEVLSSLKALASEWEAITSVETAGGQVVPIQAEYLLKELRADQPNLTRIAGLLAALLKAHEQFPGRVFTGQDLIPLHEILTRPEFQWAAPAPNPLDALYQRFINGLLRWFDKLFGNTVIGGFNPVTIVALVLLVIVLFFVLRVVFADFVNEARAANKEADGDEALTSDAAFARAQQLSRGGDYRSAVRYLYLSSLLVLDERGLMRYDRSKTNREYLRSLADSPQLAAPLAEVIEVFDDVWYGYHSLEQDSFEHYSERVNDLKEKK